MRVLVAGGTGVVGAALVQRLERENIGVTVLSRNPSDHPSWVCGDVRLPGLGLSPADHERLRGEVTHVASCFGSVQLDAGPEEARSLHGNGTRNLLSFFAGCRDPLRFLQVSSVLITGRSKRTFENRDLDVGQSFRSWYEYGKFEAERQVRQAASRVPVRIVRLGPILGGDGPVLPSFSSGLSSAVPYLLKQFPVFISHRGDFPCYASDSLAVAEVLRDGLLDDEGGLTWTYFDPSKPTLNQTLTALCSAWNVVPRIVGGPTIFKQLSSVLGPALGLGDGLSEYLDPWASLDPRILDELPDPTISGPAKFVERTGRALRARTTELMVA